MTQPHKSNFLDLTIRGDDPAWRSGRRILMDDRRQYRTGGDGATFRTYIYDAGDSTMAITGGTGAYSGARGEMRLHSRDAKNTSYEFIYQFKQ